MDLITHIDLPKARFDFTYQDPVMLIGSCFADAMGRRMQQQRLPADVNPFGTLYNPQSVAHAIERLLHPTLYTSGDLIQAQGMYHSFDHHSLFSDREEAACLQRINRQLSESSAFLQRATRLIITFGTAWVFRQKETGRIVSNCHKLPASLFSRERMTVSEIVELWQATLTELHAVCPQLHVLFTVSPIRHLADGAHGNQLSKSTLLLAVDELTSRFPQTDYFPAFELMMDELRDYRFYADDMVHPSTLAEDYIWEYFKEHYMDSGSRQLLKEWQEIDAALGHRPFHSESPAYRQFLLQTMLKLKRIQEKFPFFDVSKELNAIKEKL